METPLFDKLIKMYLDYDSRNDLTHEEKKQLIEFKAIKQALTIHIVSNAFFCENCNSSHMHTRYGNGELRCDNCDNVAKL